KLDLLTPDGQPVRWALNLIHGAKLRERVYGPQLMYEVCHRAADDGLPIFVLGGYPELLDDLTEQLGKKLPNLKFAGCKPARYEKISAEEQSVLVDEIKA